MLLRVVVFFLQGYKIIFECSFLNRLLADGWYGAYKVDCVDLSSGLVVVFGGLWSLQLFSWFEAGAAV